MSDMITISRAELVKLEGRVQNLALEKSCLQLVNNLMNRLGEVPGLENTVEAFLRLVVDNLGGTNAALYYRVASRLQYADVYGVNKVLGVVDDAIVRAAFERRELVEEVRDFTDTKMATPAFTQASDWAMPLTVGGQLVGVLKTEGMLMATTEIRGQLQPFFNYAALVLKNEIEGCLRQMEANRLAAIVQSSDDAIIGKTLDGTITTWNVGAERIYGYTASEVVGQPIELLVPAGCEHEVAGVLEQLKEGKHVERYETVRRRKDGREIHVSLTISPIKDAAGAVVGASTIARDVTERKRAEHELHCVNRALRMLSESNQALIRFTDEDSLLNEICRIIVEIGGYRLAWVGFAEQDDAKTVRPAAHAGFGAGYVQSARVSWADDERGRGPGGTAIRTGQVCIARNLPGDAAFAPWREAATRCGFQAIIAVPLASQGQRFGALGVYAVELDAFDTKEVEILQELAGDLAFGIAALHTRAAHAEVEANLQLFRQLTDQANDLIFTVEPSTGRVLDANGTACRVLGYDREQLLNLAVPDFDPAMQESSRWLEHLTTLQTVGSLTLGNRFRRKDGTTFPVEISVRYISQSQRDYLIAVVRDITERSQAEQNIALLSFALNNVREAAFLIDEEAHFHFVNQESCQTLGYTREELLRLRVPDVDPDLPVEKWPMHWADLKSRRSVLFEGRHRAKDGRIFPVEINANYLEYEGRYYNLALVRDITERKQAEAARAADLWFFESMDEINRAMHGADTLDQMMSDVLDTMLAIFKCDRAFLAVPCDPTLQSFEISMERTAPRYPGAFARGALVPVSPAVKTLFQRLLSDPNPDEIHIGDGLDLEDVVWSEYEIKSQLAIALHPKVGKPWECGLHQCSYNRAWTPQEKRLFQGITRRLGDALTGLITYRELRESEEKYRRIVDTATEGIWVLGPDSVTTFVNARIVEMTGYDPEELIGRPFTDVLFAEDVSDHTARLESRRHGTTQSYERRIRHKSGKMVWAYISATPVFDSARQFAGSLAMFTDITDRKQAEEALHQASEEVHDLYNNAPCGYHSLDKDGMFVRINETELQWLGYLREEVLGRMNFADLLTADSRKRFEENFPRFKASGVARDLEFELIRKDGSILPVLLSATVLTDRDGNYLMSRSTTYDLTERRRVEAALRDSEELYRKLIFASPDAITTTDLSGRVALSSPKALELFRVWSEDRAAGRSVLEWVAPRDKDKALVNLEHLLNRGVILHKDFLLRRDDGTTFDAEISAALVQSADGAPRGAIFITRDVTERKKDADSLRKLSRAVEQSPASIVITDTAGSIEYVNPKFTAVTGYSLADVLGRNPRILRSGEHSDDDYRQLWRTITSGKEWRGEFHNRRKDGSLYWELASISAICDGAGTITHFLAVKEDITQRKSLEEQLRQAQKLEAVGQLAGGVAHDFNNILTAILMNVSLLREEPQLTPEVGAGLEELQSEANRAASLTRQLLVFSRRQELNAKPIDLNEVINNLTKMLRRLIGEDIDLVFQGQSSNLWIMADAGMMEQVIMNLCVNARDAMPNGGTLAIGTRQVEISAERAQETLQAYPGVFTCLSVADSGCGMTDETLKHVFEPFFTTKEVGKGTGLGLATVYGIVNQHHGWIEVDSALGKGTTFRVFLPALPRPAQARSDSRNAQVRGGTETILLVEDDPGLRRQASLGLRKLGYTILEAASGADALRLWEQEHGRIALLFTDMVMPGGLTGLGLADRLMTQKPTLKTLVTSGYSVEKTKPELLAAKGINYLAKPYEASALANAVRVCLDQPHRPRADIH